VALTSTTQDKLLQQATLAVQQYVEAHPEYRIDAAQPDYRGGTNRITLGRRGEQGAVFKYFVNARRWRHELSCLRHFQRVGIVPALLDVVPERLIVMERLTGSDIGGELEDGGLTLSQVQNLSRQVGQALGKIASTPLPSDDAGYSPARDFAGLAWNPCQSRMLSDYLAICRRIQTVIPAYAGPFFTASLSLLASQVERVDRERQFLFHEDIWNTRAEGEKFRGFYDLEMCRLGTESMQLGVAVEMCGPNYLDWEQLQRGYEAEVERQLNEADLLAALAINHFYHWIRICRWGEWDGNPNQTEHLRASIEDADHYRTKMTEACEVLGRYIDVKRWFGEVR
jgi:hypothetical protein